MDSQFTQLKNWQFGVIIIWFCEYCLQHASSAPLGFWPISTHLSKKNWSSESSYHSLNYSSLMSFSAPSKVTGCYVVCVSTRGLFVCPKEKISFFHKLIQKGKNRFLVFLLLLSIVHKIYLFFWNARPLWIRSWLMDAHT